MTREEKSQVIETLTAELAEAKTLISHRYCRVRCRDDL